MSLLLFSFLSNLALTSVNILSYHLTRKRQKEGRLHDSISRVWVGRGNDAVLVAFRQKFQQHDRRTNGRTDQQSDL